MWLKIIGGIIAIVILWFLITGLGSKMVESGREFWDKVTNSSAAPTTPRTPPRAPSPTTPAPGPPAPVTPSIGNPLEAYNAAAEARIVAAQAERAASIERFKGDAAFEVVQRVREFDSPGMRPGDVINVAAYIASDRKKKAAVEIFIEEDGKAHPKSPLSTETRQGQDVSVKEGRVYTFQARLATGEWSERIERRYNRKDTKDGRLELDLLFHSRS